MNENIEFYKSLVEDILDEFVLGDSFDMERDASQFRNTEQYNTWFSKFIAEDEDTDFTDNQLCESTVSEASEDDLASFELFLEEIMEGCVEKAKEMKTEGEKEEGSVEEGDEELDEEDDIKDDAKSKPDDGCKVKEGCCESFIEEMIENYLNEKFKYSKSEKRRKAVLRHRNTKLRNYQRRYQKRYRRTATGRRLARNRKSGHLNSLQKKRRKLRNIHRRGKSQWFGKHLYSSEEQMMENVNRISGFCISLFPDDIDYACYICDKLGIDGDYYEDKNELVVCGDKTKLHRLITSLQLDGDVEDYCVDCGDDEEFEISLNVTTHDEVEEILDAAEEYDLGVEREEDGSYTVYGAHEDLEAFMDRFGLIDDEDDEYCVEIPCDVEGVEEYAEDKNLSCESENNYFVISGTEQEIDECCEYFNIANGLDEDVYTDYTMSESEKTNMFNTANDRKEAILEHLDAKFAGSQFFSSLNESDSSEVKNIVAESVSTLLEDSCKRITEDLISESERYVNEEVIPSILKTFDEEYVVEIIKNLNEQVDEYLEEVAKEVVDDLEDKKLIVKSKKSAQLESFEEELMNLIESRLQIIPEREDALLSAQNKIEELTDRLQESSLDQRKYNRKLMEAKREAYVYKNMPENISESQKEKLLSYVNNVLIEASDMNEFSSYYDDAVKQLIEMEENKYSHSFMKLDEHKSQPKEFNDNFSDLFSDVMKLG